MLFKSMYLLPLLLLLLLLLLFTEDIDRVVLVLFTMTLFIGSKHTIIPS